MELGRASVNRITAYYNREEVAAANSARDGSLPQTSSDSVNIIEQ
jgi:hypothetical protein